MSVYLAFYRGRKSIHSPIDVLYRFIDWLIRVVTWGEFSHCEIAIKDESGYVCYSSSGRDGGVRSKRIDVDNENWVLIDITAHANVDNIQHYFYLTQDAKYDYVGCIGTVLPFVKCKKRYFCSEWTYNALSYSLNKRVESGGRFSPMDLFVMCESKLAIE